MTAPDNILIGGRLANGAAVSSHVAAIPYAGSGYRMEIYGRATASKDRQLVSLEDWSHYDLYDKPEPVGLALEKVAPFFKQHLA